MAAQPESQTAETQTAETGPLTGLVKAASDALTTRFKDVERLWSETFQTLGDRVQGAERDVRGLLDKVEADGKKRLESLRTGLPVDLQQLRERLTRVDEAAGAAGLDTDAITYRLGLARAAELEALDAKVAALAAELADVKATAAAAQKKAEAAPAKRTLTALTKRVKALEAS